MNEEDPSTLSPDGIREVLGHIADELEDLSVRQTELYAQRLDLWLEGVGREPKFLQKELAEASRCTEGAVTQGLRKYHEQQAKLAAG